MADTIYTAPPEEVQKIRLRQIDGLPYGMLEVTPNGTILNYFPSQSRLATRDPAQLCGLNLFDDTVLGVLLRHLRPALLALSGRAGGSERLLLILPFINQTVRLSIVATLAASSLRIRISLVRSPALQPGRLPGSQ